MVGLTGATVLASYFYLRYTWSARPKTLGKGYDLLLFVAFVSAIYAYHAYCPDADEPHIRVSGLIIPIQGVTYSKGRWNGTGTGLITCVNSCSDESPYLYLNEPATHALTPDRSQFAVMYLGRTERPGDADIVAHPVVEIDDPESGKVLYFRDTSRHWTSAIVLFINALIGFGAYLVLLANRFEG